MTNSRVTSWAFKSARSQALEPSGREIKDLIVTSRRDSGVLVEALPEEEDQLQSPSCNLADPRDISEVIDAMKKLLRLTDLTAQEQRDMMEDLWVASRSLEPKGKRLLDKSLVTSLLLKKADSLRLPEQEADIKMIVLEVTNIFLL